MAYGLLTASVDSPCARRVCKLLSACNHQELHKGNLWDCLMAIWNVRGTLDPIIFTDIHRLGAKGTEVVKRIKVFFKFEIVEMSPDDDEISCREGEPTNAAAYILNIPSLDAMNTLWEFANETSATPELEPENLMASSNATMVEQQFNCFNCLTTIEVTPSIGDIGTSAQESTTTTLPETPLSHDADIQAVIRIMDDPETKSFCHTIGISTD